MDVHVRGTRFSVRRDEFAPFWGRVQSGDWEPESFALLDHFLHPASVLLDVGAWIGPLTLYAAVRGADCHSIEPDPVARETLLANLALNPDAADRVTVEDVAVAEVSGPVRIGSITSDEGGDSMSSLLFADGRVTWDVDGIRLEELVGRRIGRTPDLLKMDIEGAEVEVLSGSATYLASARPPLFLSVHGRFWTDPLPRMHRLLDVLSGYRELFTPALVPLDPAELVDEAHLGGLFELVAV